MDRKSTLSDLYITSFSTSRNNRPPGAEWLVDLRVRVKVARIEAMRDPQGRSGIRIDFNEEIEIPRVSVTKGDSEEAKAVQDMISALFQSGLPLFQQQSQLAFPRLVLFLQDDEREALGIRFEAGQYYDLELKNGTITIVKA